MPRVLARDALVRPSRACPVDVVPSRLCEFVKVEYIPPETTCPHEWEREREAMEGEERWPLSAAREQRHSGLSLSLGGAGFKAAAVECGKWEGMAKGSGRSGWVVHVRSSLRKPSSQLPPLLHPRRPKSRTAPRGHVRKTARPWGPTARRIAWRWRKASMLEKVSDGERRCEKAGEGGRWQEIRGKAGEGGRRREIAGDTPTLRNARVSASRPLSFIHGPGANTTTSGWRWRSRCSTKSRFSR